MTVDLERRAALLAAKLGALVRGRWGDLGDDLSSSAFPSGAVLAHRPSGRCWVLLDGGGERRLGACLAVAARRGAREVHVIVGDERGAGVLARQAQLFADAPQIWVERGTEVVLAEAAPPATDVAPAPEAERYRSVLAAAGLAPVVEGGHLIGELNGLEVARVVVVDGVARVESGVGRFDREVAAMMFAELSEADALANAVSVVADVRAHGAAPHPLNQLVPERWVRSVLVARPDLVGAAELRSVGSATPRPNLKDVGVATAVGVDLDGRPLVVTCSTGVDLELVPSAADDRLTQAPDARLLLVVPAKDALAVTTDLASHLVAPAEVVTLAEGWTALDGAR